MTGDRYNPEYRVNSLLSLMIAKFFLHSSEDLKLKQNSAIQNLNASTVRHC